MLDHIFMNVIDMSRTASIIIVIVLIARMFLKRFPKYISYALWGVVLFRLLCPFSFEFAFSLVPNLESASYQYMLADDSISTTGGDDVIPMDGTGQGGEMNQAGAMNPIIDHDVNGESEVLGIQTAASNTDKADRTAAISWQEACILLGKYVWLLGIGIMFLYSIISLIKIRKEVSVSLRLRDNIYITDGKISPLVMGVLRPRIYLPDCLSEKEQEYIILHERYHIRRLDHVIKLLAFVALSIHWFNPLVWVAFILSGKDMEMSCDEAVIRKMGENIRADYAQSLLALATGRGAIRGIPLAFGEGDTKSRVKNLAKSKKTKGWVLAIVIFAVAVLILCLVSNAKVIHKNEIKGDELSTDHTMVSDELDVSIDISEHYITNTGDFSNLYYIDEDGVLWGCGRNEYGQLGQGTQDYEFHGEMVKIAEDVVHVDYSQKGFTIYLTKDHKLYGMGNAGCGALQQYEEYDWSKYENGDHYYVSEPILLMEDVTYARCGRDDIVCLAEDGSVWTWGTIYVHGGYQPTDFYYVQKPKKILENAILVTGGWNNHAALLQNGTVWTWGYNNTGCCGVAEPEYISEPTMVAENVVMVWTEKTTYNVNCYNIEELQDIIYPHCLGKTIIQKKDGSYWACGEGVGTEEKIVSGSEADYSTICTHEFYPYEIEEEEDSFENEPD